MNLERKISRREVLQHLVAGGGLVLAFGSCYKGIAEDYKASGLVNEASQEKFPIPPSEEVIAAKRAKTASDQKIVALAEQGNAQAAVSEAQSPEHRKAKNIVEAAQNHENFRTNLASQFKEKYEQPFIQSWWAGLFTGIIGVLVGEGSYLTDWGRTAKESRRQS